MRPELIRIYSMCKKHTHCNGKVKVGLMGDILDGHVKFLIDRRVSVCNFRMQ